LFGQNRSKGPSPTTDVLMEHVDIFIFAKGLYEYLYVGESDDRNLYQEKKEEKFFGKKKKF
jgi:hypothetical protein